MIALRPRQPDDVPRLFEIWLAAVRATHGFLAAEDLDFFSQQVEQLYLPLADVEVVECDGVIVGFLGMEGSKVDALFLHPACHGQGVGRAVMADVFRRHARVTLDVNAQNPGARAFYRALGFEEVGTSPVDGAGKPYPLVHLARGTAAP